MAERSDLVLRARVVLLRNSLKRVNSALEDLVQSRPDPLEEVRSQVDSIRSQATSARNELEKLAPRPPIVATALETLNQIIETATTDVAKSSTRGPRRLLSTISGESEAVSTIRDELADGFRFRMGELDAVQKVADDAFRASGAERDELERTAWRQFTECRTRCQELFAEYVDLVRGVLVRDAGLDGDLFRIADQLVKEWPRIKDYRWESLTIPASRERRHITAARLIRIGFPEWTVWMLPLAAGEFGFIFADRYADVESAVIARAVQDGARQREELGESEGEPAIDDTEVRAWVADAFATCVMGPSYVWATMLLRADPTSRTDQRRVGVMVKVLELLASETYDPQGDFREVPERTRLYWEAAVVQANIDAGPTEHPWVKSIMKDVAAAVFDRVRSPMTADRWFAASAMADRFLELRSAASIAADVHHGQLADVLLAGWMARVRLARAGVQDDILIDLAGLVRDTAVALIDTSDETPPPAGVTARTGTTATVLAETKPAPGPTALGVDR